MKKFILIVIGLFIAMIGCGPKQIRYNEGSYEGVGHGHHGPIKVMVITDPYEIKEIKIIEEYEMPELSTIVYNKIPDEVIKRNSAQVDVIAGASYTSEGLIEAIGNGLNKAKVQQ